MAFYALSLEKCFLLGDWMLVKLALIFVIVPILEIMLLLQVGELIDLWPTVALILGTGLLGAWLMKHQSRNALEKIKTALIRGELPTKEILDGVLVLVAGVVLITPGLLTDTTGLLLLLPPIRTRVRRRLSHWLKARLVAGPIGHAPSPWMNASAWNQRSSFDDGEVIDIRPEPFDVEAHGDELQ